MLVELTFSGVAATTTLNSTILFLNNMPTIGVRRFLNIKTSFSKLPRQGGSARGCEGVGVLNVHNRMLFSLNETFEFEMKSAA
jgi:hypothetical protein